MRNECFTLTVVRPEQSELLAQRAEQLKSEQDFERRFRAAFARTTKADGTIAQRRVKAEQMVRAGVVR